jgi:hypothetical protein
MLGDCAKMGARPQIVELEGHACSWFIRRRFEVPYLFSGSQFRPTQSVFPSRPKDLFSPPFPNLQASLVQFVFLYSLFGVCLQPEARPKLIGVVSCFCIFCHSLGSPVLGFDFAALLDEACWCWIRPSLHAIEISGLVCAKIESS